MRTAQNTTLAIPCMLLINMSGENITQLHGIQNVFSDAPYVPHPINGLNCITFGLFIGIQIHVIKM